MATSGTEICGAFIEAKLKIKAIAANRHSLGPVHSSLAPRP